MVWTPYTVLLFSTWPLYYILYAMGTQGPHCHFS